MTSATMELLSIESISQKDTDRLQKDFIKLNKSNTTNVVEMGKMLIVLKERLGHGNYAKWLDTECNFSQSLANKYVKVVNEYIGLDSELIPKLGIAKALVLIAIDKNIREEYINANDIYNKSVSEVKTLVKPKVESSENIEYKAPTTDSINKIVSIFNNDIKNSLESHLKLLNDNKNILNDKHNQLIDKYNTIHKLINELVEGA